MASADTHNVPEKMQDEEKWFYLSKRELLIVIPALLLCYLVGVTTFKLGILPVGIILITMIAVFAGFIILAKIPPEKYLYGCGLKVEVIVLRMILKKLFHKKINTKVLNAECKHF